VAGAACCSELGAVVVDARAETRGPIAAAGPAHGGGPTPMSYQVTTSMASRSWTGDSSSSDIKEP